MEQLGNDKTTSLVTSITPPGAEPDGRCYGGVEVSALQHPASLFSLPSSVLRRRSGTPGRLALTARSARLPAASRLATVRLPGLGTANEARARIE